jgi:hydroxymethylpyrimidine pyrophosphatase-like HAD family hydrolase
MPPPPVHLVAIDIDGTLLPTASTTISQRNRRALLDAEDAGLHVVIATGRRHQYAAPVLKQLDLSPATIMISSNGSVVRRLNGELLDRTLLPIDSARALVGALRRFGQTMVFTFDRSDGPELVVESMAALNEKIAAWVAANRSEMAEMVPLERALDDGVPPIQGMLCGGIAQIRAAQQGLEGTAVAVGITMHRTEYPEKDLGILDLLPPRCSKAHALDGVARSLGLEATQVMAIGDNFNDQSMLEYAGHPVLMGNAGDEMQELARRRSWTVTHANDDDGVAVTLEPVIARLRARLGAAATEVTAVGAGTVP